MDRADVPRVSNDTIPLTRNRLPRPPRHEKLLRAPVCAFRQAQLFLDLPKIAAQYLELGFSFANGGLFSRCPWCSTADWKR